MMAAMSAASAVAGCSCGHQHHSHNLKSRLDTPPATPPLPSTPVTIRRPQGVAFADNSALTPAISVSSIPRGSTGGNLHATRGSYLAECSAKLTTQSDHGTFLLHVTTLWFLVAQDHDRGPSRRKIHTTRDHCSSYQALSRSTLLRTRSRRKPKENFITKIG
ncbi:hypothetical protein B566_EDAN014588, partial [Ephemera danica]